MAERTIPDAGTLTGWRKSSYSGNDAGSCLAVQDNAPSGVPIRDSKAPHGPAVVFPDDAWSAFMSAVKTAALG